ncbi:hypothetical protein M096_3373 [Parabacteroides distasonis str. 3999B T(B) 6]|nr:hypothetical protein M095_3423 [Parabacteroides distasonis str. 3999B T(B) 4]KDS66385.1 hypothetical protein M095_2667 [Parabacteroides distasonis str. 3999B T(B) 4]KDS68846.1 hypothetical protein M096_3373 [Parabacteroides distasonis str. 3999B T(B) 6]
MKVTPIYFFLSSKYLCNVINEQQIGHGEDLNKEFLLCD